LTKVNLVQVSGNEIVVHLVQVANVYFAFRQSRKPASSCRCEEVAVHVTLDRVFHFPVRVWSSKFLDNRRKPFCCFCTVAAFSTQKWQPVDFTAVNIAIVIAACSKHAFNLFDLWTTLAAFLQMNVDQRGSKFALEFAKGVCGYR